MGSLRYGVGRERRPAPLTSPATPLPGIEKPRRFRPRFHYELLACGARGHELLGMDAAEIRPQDAVVVREDGDGLRWHRCLRCDSWLPLSRPEHPRRPHPPDRDEVEVPLRGRALRDKVVLRIIAIDRALHFVVLAVFAAAIFAFAANQTRLRAPGFRILADIQGGLGGPARSRHGVLHELRHALSIDAGTLTKLGVVVAAYALLEGAEAIGLWYQRRWAEYLTFLATTALLPVEVYELSHRFTVLKVVTLVLNLAVVVYLLLAKRLFGARGGAAAEEAERAANTGWEALERTAPGIRASAGP